MKSQALLTPLWLATIAAIVAAIVAFTPRPTTARYQIVPAGSGVYRLDTETGDVRSYTTAGYREIIEPREF